MSKQRKPFSVQLVACDTHGSTFTRTYERGPMRLNKQAYTEFAIGNLLALIAEQDYTHLREFVITDVIFFP